MIFGLDVSYWNYPQQVPWELLWNLGFRVVIIKASMGGGYDSRCDEHVRYAKEAGFLVGLYHWTDPIQDWRKQAEFFINKIYQHEPSVIAMDVEQWWNDWAKWQRGEARWPQDATTAARVIGSYEIVRGRLIERFSNDIPLHRILTYTGGWFTDRFPGLAEAMNGWAIWIADYNLSRTMVHSNFNGNFKLHESEWEEWAGVLYRELIDISNGVPIMPDGHTAPPRVWQVDSAVHPPGCPIRLDINLLYDQDMSFNEWAGIEPDPEPEPDPDLAARVSRLELDAVSLDADLVAVDNYLVEVVEKLRKIGGDFSSL